MDFEHGYDSYGGPPMKKVRGDEESGSNGGGGGGNNAMNRFLERQDEKIPPNHILLITVINNKYPINAEVIYKVTSIVGKIKRIVCFERNKVIQAMVEFETLENASKARTSLHGCDIYNNCCTMKVEYSKLETLHVRENGPMSWDFTGGSEEPGKRKSILETPEAASMMGGGFPPAAAKMAMGMGMGGGGAPAGNGPMGMGMSAPLNMGNMGMPQMGGGMSSMMGGAGGFGGGGSYGAFGGGGGAAGGSHHHDMIGGYGDMGNNSSSGGYGGDGKSCVLMCYGLEPPKWNCERLFNLLCQYGNVNQIFFMKQKQNTAMVEMGSPEAVDNVMKNLRDITVFGEQVRFDVSKKHQRIVSTPPEFEMPDGSSSVKSYYGSRDMNRFMSQEQASKNRIIRPSKVLHFFGISRLSDQELLDLFKAVKAPQPNQIKWVNPKEGAKLTGVGLVYFDSIDEAMEALVLVNHTMVEGKHLKLCFSPAKF